MTGSSGQRNKFNKERKTEEHQVKKQTSENESDSEIIKEFRQYSAALDRKHDKYERIVKLSRDITIGSKRVIFSIHALSRSSNFEEDAKKIRETLKSLCENNLKAISKELLNEDAYQFLKAYMYGLQEFIEALTFFIYVTEGRFCDLAEVMEFLSKSQESHRFQLLVPLIDYILGLQDLTGELMRHCIDSFTSGRVNIGNEDVRYARELYAGFLSLVRVPSWKEFDKKTTIARQSLEKMEYASYTRHVRGSEALPALLDVFSSDT